MVQTLYSRRAWFFFLQNLKKWVFFLQNVYRGIWNLTFWRFFSLKLILKFCRFHKQTLVSNQNVNLGSQILWPNAYLICLNFKGWKLKLLFQKLVRIIPPPPNHSCQCWTNCCHQLIVPHKPKLKMPNCTRLIQHGSGIVFFIIKPYCILQWTHLLKSYWCYISVWLIGSFLNLYACSLYNFVHLFVYNLTKSSNYFMDL